MNKGLILLGLVLLMLTSVYAGISIKDARGYYVSDYVTENGYKFENISIEWDDDLKRMSLSGYFFDDNELSLIGYTTDSGTNTDERTYLKHDKYTKYKGDLLFEPSHLAANVNLKDVYYAPIDMGFSNKTDFNLVMYFDNYPENVYVYGGMNSAILTVNTTSSNIYFANDKIELQYADNTGSYSKFETIGASGIFLQNRKFYLFDDGTFYMRADTGAGVADNLIGSIHNNVAVHNTSKSGYIQTNYIFGDSACIMFNLTAPSGIDLWGFAGSNGFTYGYHDNETTRDPGAGDFAWDDSITEVKEPYRRTAMAFYNSNNEAVYTMASPKIATTVRILDAATPEFYMAWGGAVDNLVDNAYPLFCLDDTKQGLETWKTTYSEVEEFGNYSLTMTTGTNGTINALLTPVYVDASEDLAFTLTSGLSNSGLFNDTNYAFTDNFTTLDIYVYKQDNVITKNDLYVALNWEVDHFNVNKTGSSSCTVGDEFGADCNLTFDVKYGTYFTEGYSLYFSNYQTEYYVIQDTTLNNAPTVDNITINSTTPSFYQSIRCNATVNDADGAGEILTVWGNLTYGNGTVLTTQMSNTTSFDWYVDFSNLDFEGTFNCNATAYDAEGSVTNQTAGTMKSPLELSQTYNTTAYEFNNETYRATYTDNGFTEWFNCSLNYNSIPQWLDYNSSTAYTKYRTSQMLSFNNTPQTVEFNNTAKYINGTTLYNTTSATQTLLFGYNLVSVSTSVSNVSAVPQLIEGQNFTLRMNDTNYIDYDSNLTRYAFYNATNTTITLVINGLHYKNFTTTLVNETNTNYTVDFFGWTQINNGTYYRNITSSLQNFTVVKPVYTNCTNTNATIPFFSFRYYDEGNRTTLINGTFNLLYTIHNEQAQSNRVGYITVTDSTGVETPICASPAWAEHNTSLTMYYWSNYTNISISGFEAERFSTRSYYVNSQKFKNTTALNTNFDLYGVNEQKSKQYTITVKDPNNIPVQGAVVEVLKEYFDAGGGFFFVAMGSTNIEGKSYINLVDAAKELRPVNYKFRVILNNQILITEQDYYTISATDTGKTIIVLIEAFVPYYTTNQDLLANCTAAVVSDIGTTSCFVYNGARTRIDGSKLTIMQYDLLNGNDVICTHEVVNEVDFEFPSCNLGNVTGNYYTWSIELTIDNDFYTFGSFFDYTVTGVDWGGTGILIVFLLTITLVFFGLWHPGMAIVMLIVSLIVNAAFGFIQWDIAAIIWAIISLCVVLITVIR